ncbi:transposase [Ferrithrix thermotolerans]|uniref:transposase n=1 Tax=Ferrithrix thermotolerans TaxID=209649 RepID=UPI000A0400C8
MYRRLIHFGYAVALVSPTPAIPATTARVFIAEIRGDMSRFTTAGHLSAWAGPSPAGYD